MQPRVILAEQQAEPAPAPVAAARPVAARDWFGLGPFLAVLGALVLGTNADVLLGGQTFFYRDFGFFGHPLAEHHREAFWRGEVPLWNPLSHAGLPFAAQWNTLVFYPLSLIYLLLPLPWSLNLFCLGHVVLGGAGMYCLVRAWLGHAPGAFVAGLVFALNGLTEHCLMWPNNVAALGWMPWVVLAVARAVEGGGRALLVAACAVAVQFLAGAPEIILLTWVLAAAWVAGTPRSGEPARRRAWRLGWIGVLAAGLSAVQWLPFLQLLAESQRSRHFGGDVWSMPAWGWANFLVPLFRTTPSLLGVYSQDEQQWTASYYAGAASVVLAGYALLAGGRPERRVLWLAALAGGALLLALGPATPLHAGLRAVVPGMGFIRYPIKFVVAVIFVVAALAGAGLARWETAGIVRDPERHRRLFGLAALAAGLIVVFAEVAWWAPFPGDAPVAIVRNSAFRLGLFTAAMAGLWWWARPLGQRARGFAGAAWVILLAADLVTHAPRLNPVIPSVTLQPLPVGPPVAARLGEARAMMSPERQAFLDRAVTADAQQYFLGNRRALYMNCNLPEGVPKVDGFFALNLREAAAVETALRGSFGRASGLLDFLGVRHVSAPADLFGWVERRSALPWVTAGQVPMFAADAEVLLALRGPEFDPRRVVYLPLEATEAARGTVPGLARVALGRWTAHRVELDVEVEGAGNAAAWVVWAQAFYPGWRATLDDREPLRLWRANLAYQAALVPAGRHRLVLRYVDSRFRLGAGLSVLTLVAVGLVWWRSGRRRALEGVQVTS